MGARTRAFANNITTSGNFQASALTGTLPAISGANLTGVGGGGVYTSIAHFQSHFDHSLTTSQTTMDFGATEYISDSNDFSIDTNKEILTIANAGRYEINFTAEVRVVSSPTNEDDWSQVYIYAYKNNSTFIQEARTEFGPMAKVFSTGENMQDTGKSVGACVFLYQFAAGDTIQWKVEYLGDSTSMAMSNRNFIIKRLS